MDETCLDSQNQSETSLNAFNSAHEGRDTGSYTEKMDLALPAKKASIYPYIGFIPEGATIVDAGSGTGQMAESLSRDFRPAIVIALDKSHELLNVATENQALMHIKYGDAIEQNFPENSIDVKIFGTIGHEIESFGGKGEMTVAVQNTLKELKPGGKIIIRDFAKPSGTEPIYMQILTEDGEDAIENATINGEIDYSLLSTKALFFRFHQEFRGGNAFEYEILNIDGREYIKLAPEWAHEFYLRKDYTGNWRNEIEEKYTYWTEDQAMQILQDSGYKDVKVVPDPNEWILTNRLHGKIALFEKDKDGKLIQTDFPDTHMVAVGIKPQDNSMSVSGEDIKIDVDYHAMKDSIVYDEEKGIVKIGESEFKVDIDKNPIKGSKKQVYFLSDGRVLKVVRKDGLNDHNMFKAMYQSIVREGLLDEKQIPHMKVLEKDPDGPPYRYFVQETIPEGSISAANLIKNGKLTEEDIKQMATYINNFELGRKWQLDTNPFNWYRVKNENGSTTMTYIDGKIYRYEDDWEFKKIGLLQWIDSVYVDGVQTHTALIPKKKSQNELKDSWVDNQNQQVLWWKKYLHPTIQPKY